MRKLLLVCLALFSLCGFAVAQDKASVFPRASVEIQRADGSRVQYDAEWAISKAQQTYGLMNRRNLEPRQGMLFPFAVPQRVSFWMKDTLLPLDMLFFGPDLRLKYIQANTRPMDETLISPPMPVSFVLEIPAGSAAREHIQSGDMLLLPFKTKQ